MHRSALACIRVHVEHESALHESALGLLVHQSALKSHLVYMRVYFGHGSAQKCTYHESALL